MTSSKPTKPQRRIYLPKTTFSSGIRMSKSTIRGITHPNKPSPLSTRSIDLGLARLRELNELDKKHAEERARGTSNNVFEITLHSLPFYYSIPGLTSRQRNALRVLHRNPGPSEEAEPWVDVPVEETGFDNDDNIHPHTFNLTNFNVVDGLLDNLDGPVMVRRRYYRNMRVERLRARHEKWMEQLDSLAVAYLNWTQNSCREETFTLTGCPGDVDAPPREKSIDSMRHYFTLSQVIGSHCE